MRKVKVSLFTLFTMLVLAVLAVQAPAPAAAQTEPPATCLPDDPYNLEQLREVLSADTPSSTPIQVNSYLTVQYMGNGTLIDEDPEMPTYQEETGTTNPSEPPATATRYGLAEYVAFNPRTGFEFKITMKQQMMDHIHNCRTNGTFDNYSTGSGTATAHENKGFISLAGRNVASSVGMGWSNGHDSRVLVNNPSSWPSRPISQFRRSSTSEQSGCSGTLIGPRHVVTAAHCINKQSSNQWYTTTITPAKNGVGTAPFGFARVTHDPERDMYFITPLSWRNSGGYEWDFGLVILPDNARLGDNTGWMGYYAASASYLNSVDKWNRGYPKCTKENAPAGCQMARMYRDVNECNIGGFSKPNADGWNRRVSLSCDMSGGHSGSPIYFFHYSQNLQRWVPVVTFIASTEDCTLCNPSANYPNGALRITPAHVGTISTYREAFP